MDLHLNGKVALVIAASRGLGRAVALRLAQEGADTVICARSYDDLFRTAAEIRSAAQRECLAIQANVALDSDIRALVRQTLDHMGRIDILVTNAGGPPPGGFLDVPLRAWQSASELTLMSAVRLCKAVVPAMIDQRAGSILAVTSISVKQPVQGLVLSTSMRLGVVGLIKTLASELAPYGIRANVIAPGWTRTDRVSQLLNARATKNGTSVEEESRQIISEIPLGRMASPSEFAAAAAYLVSPAASYITGVVLPVDGGAHRGTL